jgi:hypothetical protein
MAVYIVKDYINGNFWAASSYKGVTAWQQTLVTNVDTVKIYREFKFKVTYVNS